MNINLRNRLLLFVLPLGYIVFMYIFLNELGYFYTTMPDPVYAYLMNGTNLASGHIEIGHFDHPGTPVQCFVAVIIFIRHLILGSGPLYQDVLMHPEAYLYTCSIVMLLLLGAVVYLTGSYVYKHTSSIGISIVFQLAPMFTLSMLEHGMYIKPEAFIIAAGVFLMAYLYIQFIHKKENTHAQAEYKEVLISSVLTGFLIATKINCLPIIILPLFLIKGIKQQILYILATAISFIIFISPVLYEFNYFISWVQRLITHNGLYGKGEEKMIDLHSIKSNLIELLTTDVVFTLIYVIISIAFIVTIFNTLIKKKSDGIYSRAILGVWLFITILVFLVAKHFKFYYIFPAGISLSFGLLVSYHTISIQLQPIFKLQKRTALYYLAGALSLIGAFNYFQDILPEKHENSTLEETRRFIESKKNMPVIIANGCEAAYIEPALYFGIVYTGHLTSFYLQFEQKQYPNSYLYDVDARKLMLWGKEFITPEIFSKNDSVLVYSKGREEVDDKAFLQELITYNGLKLGEYRKVYSSTNPNENIYVIKSDKALSVKLLETKSVASSDLEKLDSTRSGFISADGKSVFAKANQASQNEHHSGVTSILLDAKNPYGLDHAINVKPGYFIDATIWRKSRDNDGVIVLSAPKSDQFYKGGQSVINTANNRWEQIECKCRIPSDYKDSVLNFYLYYNGGKEAYFDDVNITVYPMN